MLLVRQEKGELLSRHAELISQCSETDFGIELGQGGGGRFLYEFVDADFALPSHLAKPFVFFI